MQKQNTKKKVRPPQHQQQQPGLEWKMNPKPQFFNPASYSQKKLTGKVALITGGDSGIGRAVAVSFAENGARVAILYLNETRDASDTRSFIEKETGSSFLTIPCDIQKEENCIQAVEQVIKEFGQLDILVNNAAVHYPQDDIQKITSAQLEKTFYTNVFSMFYLTKAALHYLKKGSSIINTASVTAYRGSAHLIDYAATKGAIVSFTRSLSSALAEKKIRVNGVAPGPVWTPLIPASFKAKDIATFGSEVPLKRAGETSEIAPCYVFLASDDSSYITGQFLHPNGGEIVNG
jgi:NAD(P)-dependent dehydrogenase (short-subunit alcohol dehydrogenase family)